ncbi:MAG: response regulator [Pseudanabaenaceae cyanobacterium SKYGB_i_bin29]|nr:response regulator [Pseudanabaenaceae cyanobacterium SKYG29]MDW8422034.1 response regulator [Pseudanabaenaceae cyanobacterium SKYGB_i_bin29]
MMIEDEELRSLYKVASAEHIAKLEEGLLHLERNPQDQKKLEELLRHAHSLKGDSRMLGVKDAETLTHHLEDILSGIKQGTHRFSPSVFETLFTGLDAIKKIAQEAVTGEPANVSAFHIAAEMMAVLGESEATPPIPLAEIPVPELSQEGEDDLAALLALAQERERVIQEEKDTKPIATAPEIEVKPEQLDTVRVELSELDALLQYTGEIAVTQQRLSRQLELVRSLSQLWEEVILGRSEQKEIVLNRIGEILPKLQTNLENDSTRLRVVAEQLAQDIRELQLLPFSTIFNLFPRTVRDIAKSQNKEVNFTITGAENLVDRKILEEIKAPLSHLLRNAIDHGIESPAERVALGKPATGNISLVGKVQGNEILIEVTDDGRGLDTEKIGRAAVEKGIITPAELALMSKEEIQSLIFRPGFSTKTEVSEISGRGVGLDVVKDAINRLQGQIRLESQVGVGCVFRLILRANRSVVPTLVVRSSGVFYGIPIDYVVTSLLVRPEEVVMVADRPQIIWQGQNLPVSFLADILQQHRSGRHKVYPCVIVQTNESKQGLIVEAITDYQEVQLREVSLVKAPQLLGSTLLSDGSICYVLNVSALLSGKSCSSIDSFTAPERPPLKVLLVEDSLPIRTQLRRILEKEGYLVTVAVDGLDGLQKFQQDKFDVVVSDVEMPNLNGIEMTQRIRSANTRIPIILVTTLAKAQDRERGLKAGANAYITKGDFDQSVLLSTIRRLAA